MATTAVAPTTLQDVVLHFGPEVTRSQSASAALRDQWRSRKTKNKNKDKDKDGALGNRVHDIPEWRKKHVRHATHPRKLVLHKNQNSTGERCGTGKTQCLYSLPQRFGFAKYDRRPKSQGFLARNAAIPRTKFLVT